MSDFERDFLLKMGAMFGISYEQMTAETRMTAAEVETRIAEHRERHERIARLWDQVTRHAAIKLATSFFLTNQLRMWRLEVGRTISMRKFLRLRGRVKAGRPIPEAPCMLIDFDVPKRGLPLPFVRPL